MEVFQMLYSKLMTMVGIPWSSAEAELDKELPADAYSPVPGGASLTDIDPAFMRDEFNRLFGVCGFGWGYEYDEENVVLDIVKRGQGSAFSALVKKLTFWVKLLDEEGKEILLKISSSGGSVNDVQGYALSGAITNAIGKASSNIGFQKSVYLGSRSHKNVGKGGPKPAAENKPTAAVKPAAAKPAPAQKAAAPKPQPKQEEPVGDEIIDDDPAIAPIVADDSASFAIPFGNRKGQALGDVDLKYIAWYANDMKAEGDPDKVALQGHAKKLLKIRSNGHAVPA
jgi:hypothetical protein